MKTFSKLLALLKIVSICRFQPMLLALLVLSPQVGQAREYSVAETPAWVQRVSPDYGMQIPESELIDGVFYLLADEQVSFEKGQRHLFQHFVSQAVNDKGLGTVASISISFDPAYQSLVLHSINVIRQGRVISKLKKATVRVFQREKELEAQIFDGRKTANVFLEDVRVGDVVEYSYTVSGSNPVFGGRHFGGVDMGWRMPVGRRYARLLVPRTIPLKLTYHRTDLRPVERNQDASREYVWDVHKLAPILVDSDTPTWYDPYPWIQWSEFEDWGAVARWAEPMYRAPGDLSPALQAVVNRITAENKAPAERLLAVLQFVQREIRYLGIEIGAASHAPSAPDLVLQRRFGDCKDKTLLMVTLLRAMGIDAQPALVNTDMQRGIRDMQPNPAAFNHAIVHASIDGRGYWLDPTRAPQAGTIKTIFQPDFGLALLVNSTTHEFSSMESDAAARVQSKKIVALFDSHMGLDKPVNLTVTTQAEGVAAEILRNTLSSSNREELQKNFLNFYADTYPGIELASPFEVKDSPRSNQLEITEHYVLKDFWVHNEELKRLEASSYVPDMESFLRHPSSTRRADPLRVIHPVDVTVQSIWLLPEAWSLKTNNTRVDDPAFVFDHHLHLEDNGRKVVETDHFVTRADYVAGADVPRYVANLDKVRDALGLTLSKRDADVGGNQSLSSNGLLDSFNWSVAMLTLVLLVGLAWLAQRVYRYDPAPLSGEFDPQLQGIGGWLLLVAVGILIQPLKLLVDMVKLAPVYASDSWMQLTMVGQPQYHALWAPVLLYELAVNLSLLVFSILLLILFFKRRRSVPYVYVAYHGVALFFILLDLLAANFIPMLEQMEGSSVSSWQQVIQRLLIIVIWGGYFMTSKRVKATFVNTWNKDEKAIPSNTMAVPAQVQEGRD